MKFVLGIDVGGTTVKIGQFDKSGELLRKWEIFTDLSEKGKNIVHDIYLSINEKIENLEDIIGYGFGVPGPVVNNSILQCVNLGWGKYDLALEFSQLVKNSNVIVKNDANVAALGELFNGAARGKRDAVMITLGTGVGGGIISNGEVLDGSTGAGGEIGHIVVDHSDHAYLCNCGSTGCLETVSSATGVKNELKRLFLTNQYKTAITDPDTFSAKNVFDLAKDNDELCVAVVDNLSKYLAYACHIFSVTTNPEVIVIGGGVSNAGDFLIDHIKKHFRNYHFMAVQDTVITLAKLGNDAGIYGAASLIIND